MLLGRLGGGGGGGGSGKKGDGGGVEAVLPPKHGRAVRVGVLAAGALAAVTLLLHRFETVEKIISWS